MPKLTQIDQAAADGNYSLALKFALKEAYALSHRLNEAGGEVEVAASEACYARLMELLNAMRQPAECEKLIFLAFRLGVGASAAHGVASGDIYKIAKNNVLTRGRRHKIKADNPNTSEWNLTAFAARAAIRHYNPEAGPAEVNAKVFRYVHHLGMTYKKDSFAKALGRNPSKVQKVDRALAKIAAGGAVDDHKLQTACADALKHFRPK